MFKRFLVILSLILLFPIYGNAQEIKTSEIKEVIIRSESDPEAIQLLKKVNRKFDDNSPMSLPSHEFRSYQKIALDVDKDSIINYQRFVKNHHDSIQLAKKEEKKEDKELVTKKIKDSAEAAQEDFYNLAKDSQFFLWEKAEQHLYSQEHGTKIYLLDNRISGLSQPIYELLTLRTNLYKVPKEIRPENFHRYIYHLKEDIDYYGRPTHVIKFREIKKKNNDKKRRYSGYIYIDKETLGIAKIESNSKKFNQGNIVSEWKYAYGKWFLDEEFVKMNVGKQIFNVDKVKTDEGKKKTIKKKYGNYIYITRKFFDIESPTSATAKDFKGYTYSIKNTDGSLLDQYRTDSLTTREKNAYTKIDKLGKKYKIDQKASILSTLLRGKLRTGYIDWDITKFIGYNYHEGFRLGAGAELNHKYSKTFSPNGYFAYGFKDEKWKYGVGMNIKMSQNRTSMFQLSYADDVEASGRFNENFWNTRMKLANTGVGINNNRYFSYQRFQFGYEYDITNSFSGRLTAKRTTSESKFDYQYKQEDNQFEDASVLLSLYYSPRSKNVMTPMGKYTYKQGYPEFFLNVEKSFEAAGGDYDYTRIDALFSHRLKGTAGITNIRLFGGYVIGEAPIYNSFEMGGLKRMNSNSLGSRLSLGTYMGFATMDSGEYFNDRFLGYQLSHRLPFQFSIGKGLSSISVLYKGEIGDFKHKDLHHFDFQELDHLFQEVGLEYNNLFNTRFDLGVFYKVGYYNQPNFKDNFAIQIKYSLLDF